MTKRFTVSIPKDLKRELDTLPHIYWPEIAKQAIIKKLQELEHGKHNVSP